MNQFKNYLKQSDFEYIFDRQKLLRDVADPDGFVKKKFKEVMSSPTNKQELFNTMSDELKEILDLKGLKAQRNFERLIDDTSSSLYNFIKIE